MAFFAAVLVVLAYMWFVGFHMLGAVFALVAALVYSYVLVAWLHENGWPEWLMLLVSSLVGIVVYMIPSTSLATLDYWAIGVSLFVAVLFAIGAAFLVPPTPQPHGR